MLLKSVSSYISQGWRRPSPCIYSTCCVAGLLPPPKLPGYHYDNSALQLAWSSMFIVMAYAGKALNLPKEPLHSRSSPLKLIDLCC